MKVGIIGFSNLTYMPYLRGYTKIFDQYGVEYEIIYWDRRGISEKCNVKAHVFQKRIDDSAPKIAKLTSMLQFGKFAKEKVKDGKYDFLVILTTIPAILLSNYIKRNYSERYIVDIRDYTYEKYKIYYHILEGVLNKAAMRVVSSPTFKQFLPENKYTICHNLSIPFEGNRDIRAMKSRNKDVINISYIGSIGYFNEVVKLLDTLANDNRFTFSFYGSGIDEKKLKEYCILKNINNVYFHGMYQSHEKESFYEETDIIYNVYGNDSLLVKYALSNKLYDAAWYRIPILVSPDTAMSETAGSIGFEVNYENSSLADQLYHWYNSSINWKDFEKSSNIFIDSVIKDNKEFERKLLDIVNRKE